MQVVWDELPEAARLDELATMLDRLRRGEVLTITLPENSDPQVAGIVERAGDAYDHQILIAPHKKKPMRLLHLKRKHRPGAP